MSDEEDIEFFDYVDQAQSCSVSTAVRSNDIQAMLNILKAREKNPRPLSADNRGWTALHVAASQSQSFDCLDLLLRYRKNVILNIDSETFEHETPLYLACKNNCRENVALLLENGCSSDIMKMDNTSPIHVAVLNGNVDVVKILVKHKVDINDQDWDDMTPLRIAVMKRNETICRILLEHKADDTLRDVEGNAPLHAACDYGFPEIVKLLVDHNMYNNTMNFQNKRGVSPFMYSVQSGDLTSVEYLLLKGADTNLSTVDGCIALHFAAILGNKQILETVLQHTRIEAIETWCLENGRNVVNTKGIFHSLICCAINSGSVECMRSLLKSKLRKSILAAPHIENQNSTLTVFSPLAFLFSTHIHSEDAVFSEFLQLIIDYDIIYITKFTEELGILWNSPGVELVNPFSLEWIKARGFKYSQTLIKHGISVDYCLKCYNKMETSFNEFGKSKHLELFYGTLVEALYNDDDNIVRYYLMNSKLLEPQFVWNYMTKKVLPCHQKCTRKICRFLSSLIPTYCIGHPYNVSCHCCTVINTPDKQIGLSNLQQLCRKVIRECLRIGTLKDNLSNFDSRVQSLPLPNILKNYLFFKERTKKRTMS